MPFSVQFLSFAPPSPTFSSSRSHRYVAFDRCQSPLTLITTTEVMDQGIIDQLDRLQRGARVLDASSQPRYATSAVYSAYDADDQRQRAQEQYHDYNNMPGYAEEPMQLDAFGKVPS